MFSRKSLPYALILATLTACHRQDSFLHSAPPPHSSVDTRYSLLVQAYVGDRTIVQNDAEHVSPAASTSKLLVAIAAIDHYLGDLRAQVVIPARAFSAHNVYYRAIRPGSALPLRDLLTHMIVQSDNFSANVLIDDLGLKEINATASRLRLAVTRLRGNFVESTDHVLPLTFTTPHDCNRMLRFILSQARTGKESERRIAFSKLLTIMSTQEDRRFVPAAVRPTPVSDKTGEIAGQINDCAIIDPFGDRPVLFSILATGDFNVYGDPALYDELTADIRDHIERVYRDNVVSKGPFSAHEGPSREFARVH